MVLQTVREGRSVLTMLLGQRVSMFQVVTCSLVADESRSFEVVSLKFMLVTHVKIDIIDSNRPSKRFDEVTRHWPLIIVSSCRFFWSRHVAAQYAHF